jgi:hypothetical protein
MRHTVHKKDKRKDLSTVSPVEDGKRKSGKNPPQKMKRKDPHHAVEESTGE